MEKFRFFVSMLGSRESYLVPRTIQRLGYLEEFYTDAWVPKKFIPAVKLLRISKNILSRTNPEIDDRLVKQIGLKAFFLYAKRPRDLRKKYKWDMELCKSLCECTNHHLKLKSNVKNLSDSSFLGFTSGSLESFHLAKKMGMMTYLDQYDPGEYEDNLIAEEAKKFPEWATTLFQRPKEYHDRVAKEWNEADKIIALSKWQLDCMVKMGADPRKISILPLAFDPGKRRPINELSNSIKKEFTVLWLGTVSLRKGFHYLAQAAALLSKTKEIKFIVAGPIRIPKDQIPKLSSNIKLIGPIPRISTEKLYEESDVFVLPTLSDSFGITQIEAMSYGIPVISTPNCGEVVRDGINGYIVPSRNAEMLAAKILQVFDNSSLHIELKTNALKTANNDFSINKYTDNLRKLINEAEKRKIN